MHHGQIATEIIRDRMREIHEQQRIANLLRDEDRRREPPTGPLRRAIARVAVAVSHGAESVARHADGSVLCEPERPRSSVA